MVGQYLNKNNSTFFLHRTPHSQPHYINDLLTNIVEFVGASNVEPLSSQPDFSPKVYSLSGSRDAFRYRIAEYTGGSDQYIFNDGLIDVPSAFFLIWPDHYYHSSGDKPEICDPTQLKRTSFFAAAALVYLMDDDPLKAQKMAGEIFSRGNARIAMSVNRAHNYLNDSGESELYDAYKEGINFVVQAYKLELSTIETLKAYSKKDLSVDVFVDELKQNMSDKMSASINDVTSYYKYLCKSNQLIPEKYILSKEEKEASKIFPVRNPDIKGPLGSGFLREKLEGKNVSTNIAINRASGNTKYEVLNFIDGKNSLLDIRNAVSAEYEPIPIEWVMEFLQMLEAGGILTISN
jgi:hypothetical protein